MLTEYNVESGVSKTSQLFVLNDQNQNTQAVRKVPNYTGKTFQVLGKVYDHPKNFPPGIELIEFHAAQ